MHTLVEPTIETMVALISWSIWNIISSFIFQVTPAKFIDFVLSVTELTVTIQN